MNQITEWLEKQYNVDCETIIKALRLSPSAQGYIYGAVSEVILIEYLCANSFEVKRIKEKPSGGFDEKKVGYKGDFLINKVGTSDYYVIECKGLKSNSEFRGGETSEEHKKSITKKQAFDFLKKFINIDKQTIYNNGYSTYVKTKTQWELENPEKTFPDFCWDKEHPGPNSADLTPYFKNLEELKSFIDKADSYLFSETSFRNKKGLYKVLQTHKPSNRVDAETNIKQAAPLKSDFSILAVDLFLRTGKHEFVFVNPEKIAHSPSSPNHLYQNYIIDILIPGKKDNIDINYPWYKDINTCIIETNPKKVKYDSTQIDYRYEDLFL